MQQPRLYRVEIGSPTVAHEPGLSTAYENGGLFSGEYPKVSPDTSELIVEKGVIP
jgi:hypothetical protein